MTEARHGQTQGAVPAGSGPEDEGAAIPDISLCIPAYEMHGRGAAMLDAALASAAGQKGCAFEVVVADQSDDGSLEPVCARWGAHMALRRIDSRDVPRGNSANSNRAIAAARGRIVKILFQDDRLACPDALAQIARAFDDPACLWLLSGWTDWHPDGPSRDVVPRLNPLLAVGLNTVGHPSVMAVRREHAPMFNPRFDWLMDVDYYQRCLEAIGQPVILAPPLVEVRRHAGQHSHRISATARRHEVRDAMRLHGMERSPRAWLYYLSRYLKR